MRKLNSSYEMTPLTLAITTIGDLLYRSRLTKNEYGTTIENVQLNIPNYQRPYKWTAKNCLQLIDDIEEALANNKEVYRLGTLILHLDNDKYSIVDGQQRVISLALLLQLLKKRSTSTNNSPIPLLDIEIDNNNHTHYNINHNSIAMGRRVDRLDEDGINKLEGYIANRCELIVVITKNLSQAFQFFDSQNSRGKKLYPHDLLKAYHLREMATLDESETEAVVSSWEQLNQSKLSQLFNDYLYRVREWLKGNRTSELSEKNIDLFKGVSAKDSFPYAQFYKGAYAYAESVNNSHLPFVIGLQNLRPFQLNAPIIAGKPFFDFTKYYFDILADIRDNSKYEGYFINGNSIIETLQLGKYRTGVGNTVTRLMLDVAILLYVDRFCPSKPSRQDIELLDQFVIFAFVWAYSMRAQYSNVGWRVAQNFIMGTPQKYGIRNAINIYKLIIEADKPEVLLSRLSNVVLEIEDSRIVAPKDNWNDVDEKGVPQNYLYYFDKYNYWRRNDEERANTNQ